MSIKKIFIISMAIMFVGCNQNTPTAITDQERSEDLIGIWNGQLYMTAITSLVFTDNGILNYRQTSDGLTLNGSAGTFYSMEYYLQNDSLIISGRSDHYYGKASLPYTTSFSIEENVLVVDSFQFFTVDGGVYNSLQLRKADKIGSVSLSKTDAEQLKHIFSPSNELLKNNCDGKVTIIRNMDELQSICPAGIRIPSIDFSKECILYAYAGHCDSEVWNAELYYNPEVDLYELLVVTENNPQSNFFAYGIFDISSEKIVKIKPMVQLVK